MWKVQQEMEGQRLILNLIGRVERPQLQELQRLISSQAASREVVLDLDQLKLVDQETVTFLSLCEALGVKLQRCPAYIREWIASASSAH